MYTREKRSTAKITDSHVCESKQTLQPLFVECQHFHSFWNLFASWWNYSNSPIVSLTNNDKIYGYLAEKRSIHTFNVCLHYVIISIFFTFNYVNGFTRLHLNYFERSE